MSGLANNSQDDTESTAGQVSYWWVNNKQTFAHEIGGNYLWSPRFRRDGGRNEFYDNMQRIRPGDVVFAYARAQIRAVGECIAPAVRAGKPAEFGIVGDAWRDDGWLVRVRFTVLETPLRPADHMDIIAPTLPATYSPLRETGQGNQGAYLASISEAMAQALIKLLGETWKDFVWREPTDVGEMIEAQVVNNLKLSGGISTTEMQQLVMARRGQGSYRRNLCALEKFCRVTGATNLKHLRASHMKPWRVSNNDERLSGNNGLLLSPHVDHLFDQGYITFNDSGALIISSQLDRRTIECWRIMPAHSSACFRQEQLSFIKYHREYIFRN